MEEQYDVAIIGAGPGGRAVVRRLAGHGLAVVITERELVGGECPYWACIPAKSLLRPGEVRLAARRAQGLSEPELTWSDVARYRDDMISNLDDAKPAAALERDGATLVRGAARLSGPGRVIVADRVLRADRIVIATGSQSAVPAIEGLTETGFWTNRELTTMQDVPPSAIVLGGGPVGIEGAQFLARFGCEVTVVESADRLLAREDPAVSEAIAQSLAEEGTIVRLGVSAERARIEGGRCVLQLGDGSSIAADKIVVAAGRTPRTADIGLEAAGVAIGEDGAVQPDAQCRIGDGIWAVGDVTAVAPFTHVAHYQGRIVADTFLGRNRVADYRAIPRVVFGDPEIAAVGLSRGQAQADHLDVVEGGVDLEQLARTETFGTGYRGEMRVLVDRGSGELVGAWAVGPCASEWIGAAVVAVKARMTLATLRDMPMQFPTFGEALGYAVDDVDL